PSRNSGVRRKTLSRQQDRMVLNHASTEVSNHDWLSELGTLPKTKNGFTFVPTRSYIDYRNQRIFRSLFY
ncbi:MAG TPA: hypothetical protein PLO74_04915, partial [Thermotogota bacterium]|nr:hypothetical protein [Thermotogota bacterium]